MSILNLAVAKQLVGLGSGSVDPMVQILIDGVEEWVEGFCSLKFVEATRVDLIDGGDISLFVDSNPILSITKIERIDSSTDVALVPADEYRLADDEILKNPFTIHNTNDGGHVTTSSFTPRRWTTGRKNFRVTYIGGYDGAANVPNGLIAVMYDLLVRAYRNRGGEASSSVSGLSVNWQRLLDSDMSDKLNNYRFRVGVG